MSVRTKDWPTVHRYIDGGYVWTVCPEHGPDVAVDDDGCCTGCGADSLFYGDDPGGRPATEPPPDGARTVLMLFEADDGNEAAEVWEVSTWTGSQWTRSDPDLSPRMWWPLPSTEPAAGGES